MRLYFIAAVMGDNLDDSLDLFVKANSPTEAIGYWRLHYDLSATDTWYDSIREVPCVVEGEAGAIAWESMPEIDKETIGTARVDTESLARVVLDLNVEEFDRIKIALDWYSDDRRECAKAEEGGFSICEPDPAEHITAAEEAESLLAKLRSIGTLDVVEPVSESAHVPPLALAARNKAAAI